MKAAIVVPPNLTGKTLKVVTRNYGVNSQAPYKPLLGKNYDDNTPTIDITKDVVSALGGVYTELGLPSDISNDIGNVNIGNVNIVNVLDYGAVAEGNLYLRNGVLSTLDQIISSDNTYIKDCLLSSFPENWTTKKFSDLNADQLHNYKQKITGVFPGGNPRLILTHHDDTDAIQTAINECVKKGGGIVYFPKPKNRNQFYRIDKQPYEYYNPATMCGYNLSSSNDKRLYYDTETKRYIKEDEVDLLRFESGKIVALQELKSQLYVPGQTNLLMLGEVQPVPLKHYHVVDGTNNFGYVNYGQTWEARNVVLRSSIDAPSFVTKYAQRPWSVLACPTGNMSKFGSSEMRTSASTESFAMKNIEIRVHIDCLGISPKLFPTMGAVNMSCARRVTIYECFFGLDNEVGSNWYTDFISEADRNKKNIRQSYDSYARCLQKSGTTTIGLFCTFEDNERNLLHNVTVQGFKFGIIVPEMTNAGFIHISNCEYAMCFMDATHLTVIDQLSTHNNRRAICAIPIPKFDPITKFTTIFGCVVKYREWFTSSWNKPSYLPTVNIRILAHDYEHGHWSRPFISQMRYGVWDPQNRMCGTIMYHQGFPGGKNAGVLSWGEGYANVLTTLLSAEILSGKLSTEYGEAYINTHTKYDIINQLKLSAYDILELKDLADLPNAIKDSQPAEISSTETFSALMDLACFANLNNGLTSNDYDSLYTNVITDNVIDGNTLSIKYLDVSLNKFTKYGVLDAVRKGQAQWKMGQFNSLDHCYYDHRNCNYKNDTSILPDNFKTAEVSSIYLSADESKVISGLISSYTVQQFDIENWETEEWTREKYDFLTSNNETLRSDQISVRKFNLTADQMLSGDIPLSCTNFYAVAGTQRPPCPKTYFAPNYGSYYPVLGATRVRIVHVNDNNAIYTLTEQEKINTTGYAIRRNTSDGALVFSGGETYNTGSDNNATLVLYGGNHDLYPGAFSLKSGCKGKEGSGVNELAARDGILAWSGEKASGEAFSRSSMPNYIDAQAIDLKYVFTFDTIGGLISKDKKTIADPMPIETYLEPHQATYNGETVTRYLDSRTTIEMLQHRAMTNGAEILTDKENTKKMYTFVAPKSGWIVFYNTLPANSHLTVVVHQSKDYPVIIYAQTVDGYAGKTIGLTFPCPKDSYVQMWITGAVMNHIYDYSADETRVNDDFNENIPESSSNPHYVVSYTGVCRFIRSYSDNNKDLPATVTALKDKEELNESILQRRNRRTDIIVNTKPIVEETITDEYLLPIDDNQFSINGNNY